MEILQMLRFYRINLLTIGAFIVLEISCSSAEPIQNTYVKLEIEKHLSFVTKHVNIIMHDTNFVYTGQYHLPYSVCFLENLTDIESGGDINFIGWRTVTQQDVLKWEKWYDVNKEKLPRSLRKIETYCEGYKQDGINTYR